MSLLVSVLEKNLLNMRMRWRWIHFSSTSGTMTQCHNHLKRENHWSSPCIYIYHMWITECTIILYNRYKFPLIIPFFLYICFHSSFKDDNLYVLSTLKEATSVPALNYGEWITKFNDITNSNQNVNYNYLILQLHNRRKIRGWSFCYCCTQGNN